MTAETTTAAAPPAPSPEGAHAASCCGADEQSSCCAASEKSSCCGPEATATGGCGCR